MTNEERELAESEISESWSDDAGKSPDAFACSEEEVYRLGLECAKLRASLAESTRLAEWWEEEHGRERAARHAWVAWAREHGAIATGPDAEPESRKMLEAIFSSGGKP